MNSDKSRINIIKSGEERRSQAGFCTLFLLVVLVIISATAGCTETADENTAAEVKVIVEEEVPVATPAEEADEINMNDAIAIDLVSMYHDVQNKNPLAFDYEIMPTRYIGLSDSGDYKFEGTISNFSTHTDMSNYACVMFTEKDNTSETGYHEWIYKGFKYDVFAGNEGREITIEFTVNKEDIPKEKTIIMTGYDLYQI